MSENVLNLIINKRTDKEVVGMKKMGVLSNIINKRVTLSYGTDFLNRKKRDRTSEAMKGYNSLSTEGKRDVNKILISEDGVVGVYLWPTAGRKTKQEANEYGKKGNVVLVLKTVPKLEGMTWFSDNRIGGIDFLENIIIKTLGIKFEKTYEDMIKYANDPKNTNIQGITVPRIPETNIEQRLKDVEDIYKKQINDTKEKDANEVKEKATEDSRKINWNKKIEIEQRKRLKEIGTIRRKF